MIEKCPACGCQADPGGVCPACGLIYAKYSASAAAQRAVLKRDAEERIIRGRRAYHRWGRVVAWVAPPLRALHLTVGLVGAVLMLGGVVLLFALLVWIVLRVAFF